MAYQQKGGQGRGASGNGGRPGREGERGPRRQTPNTKPHRAKDEGQGHSEQPPYRFQKRPEDDAKRPQGARDGEPIRQGYRPRQAGPACPKAGDTPPPRGQAPLPSAPPPDELPYLVMGRNAVKEALKSGRSIDRILVVKERDGSLGELVNLARDRNIQLREVDRAKLDALCLPFGHGSKPGNHQGIVAQVPGVEYCGLEDILQVAKARNEPPFVVLLDGIEDPHNLGSILRSAECAGAHGVVLPKRRSASVTAAACKASAGAVEYIKVARVANLVEAMRRLKAAGLWLAGADMKGTPMAGADLKGPLGLVIGGEGGGLGKLVRESCDFLVSIPMAGHLDSLNAAVAAAILMFEKKRQG